MEFVIVIIFVIGYTLIALEHPIKINKTATALITGVLCWMLFALSSPSASLLQDEHYKIFLKSASTGVHSGHIGYVLESLGHHLKEIAEVLFFLMGAMTIVE